MNTKQHLLPALVLTVSFLTLTPAARAADEMMHHHGMMHMNHGAPVAKTTKHKKSPFPAINRHMHQTMDVALTGYADADFVRGMIPHHQGAIDMAKAVLAHGKDPQVAVLAQRIIKAQQGEIYWMNRWLEQANQSKSVPTGNGAMKKSAKTPEQQKLVAVMHTMHMAMDTPITGNADIDFVRGMIPHHQGAIDMAKWESANGRSPEIRSLAHGIITAQRAEIAWMNDWLAKHAK